MIKIGTNSQSIEHHHHHIHHLGNGACVDTTPFMTPAQSVENFYQPSSSMLNQDNHSTVSGSIGGLVGGGTAALTEDFQNLEDDETLSVAGTEYSEAPSVARSYTISHSAQVWDTIVWYGIIVSFSKKKGEILSGLGVPSL